MSSQQSTGHRSGRMSRLAGNAHVVAGLTAVYGPIVLAFLLPLAIWGKAYFVLALWASEGILWTWLQGRAERRRHGGELGLWNGGR